MNNLIKNEINLIIGTVCKDKLKDKFTICTDKLDVMHRDKHNIIDTVCNDFLLFFNFIKNMS